MEKWKKNKQSGHFSVTFTGTPSTCTSTCYVLVVFGKHVPVHVRHVPVHLVLFFLFRPVFVF